MPHRRKYSTPKQPPQQLCLECRQLTTKRHLCNLFQFPDLLIVMRQLIDFIFSEQKLQLEFERGVYRSVITVMGGPEAFAHLVYNTIDPDIRASRGQVITVKVLHAIRLKQTSNRTTWEDPYGGYLNFVTQADQPTYLRCYVGQSLCPYSRYKVVQLLSDSPDFEIREWALHRNTENYQVRRYMDKEGYYSAFCRTISTSLSLEGSTLTQANPQSWFRSTIAKIQHNNSTIGTEAEIISIDFEPTPLHDYNEDGQVISIPWGLRESGYVYTSESFQVQSFTASEYDFLRDASRELIAGTRLRVIIILALTLDGVAYNTWVEIQQKKIARIFIRAPIPLSKLWASHGRQAYELTSIFKFCCLAMAMIIPPANPTDLEPVLGVWLADKGFERDESLLRLAEAVGGSLRYGLLALLASLPRSRHKRPRPQRFPQSKLLNSFRSGSQLPDPQVIHNESSLIPAIDNLELIEDEEYEEILGEKESPIKPFSFRAGLKGSGRAKRRSFTLQHCTIFFDMDHQLADMNHVWVKAELSPIDERHPRAWATAAQDPDQDTGARLAFRIYQQDENGVEVCLLRTKPRRYIYIDDRYAKLKREYPELIPGPRRGQKSTKQRQRRLSEREEEVKPKRR
ncbi:hypothetical protein BJX96DRAFT_168883 [Aspergillus floccosus]